MRSILLASSLLYAVSLASQNGHIATDKIHLGASVVEQRYCADKGDGFWLLMRVRLLLSNYDERPIETYVPLDATAIVSRTKGAAAARHHELEMHKPDRPLRPPSGTSWARVKKEVVSSRESVESVDIIQLPVREGVNSGRTALTPGAHYLQMQIDVFPQGTKEFDLVSAARRIISSPVRIAVLPRRETSISCSAIGKQWRAVSK